MQDVSEFDCPHLLKVNSIVPGDMFLSNEEQLKITKFSNVKKSQNMLL